MLGIIPLPFAGGIGQPNVSNKKGSFAAFMLGLIFGIALGPCTFAYLAPMLAIVFSLSSTQLWYGMLLLLAYGISHCSVIVFAETFTESVEKYLHWNERSSGVGWIKKICGVLVMLGGLYLVFWLWYTVGVRMLAMKTKISKNVIWLGFVSFFNDIASEMIYPIIPIFLTSVLGAPVAVVGLIEGIAESTASVLKVISGWLSDKWQSRKPFTIVGYSISAVSKLLLGLAFAWPLVLFARFIDRFGKGVRTSSRDALICESSDISDRGKAFGFHRGLDTLGAVIGPLLALIAIRLMDNNLRLIFFISFIPAFIGILLLVFFVSEKKKAAESRAPFRFDWRGLNPSFNIFLAISFIFALGNSSDAFLILRAQNLGMSLTLVVLAYTLFNLAYSVFSLPAGIIADKIGPRKVLFTGFLFFAAIYLFFGLAPSSFFLWFLFPAYGIYMALTEGVGKAYISSLVPNEKTGTAFGIYQTSIGLCTFLASFFAGLLWTYVGVSAPFIFGSVTAVVSALLFAVLEQKKQPAAPIR